MFSLMSYSAKSLFSVAKFTIEGVGQGTDSPHKARSVPPRLPDYPKAPLLKTDFSFPINPFSLSRNSSSNSYICTTASQGFVANVPDTVISPAPASVSTSARPLFPNPFLLKQNSNLYSTPASLKLPTTKSESLTDSSRSYSPQIVVQATQPTQSSHTLPLPNLPTTTTSSLTIRKPRKPRPDRVLASSSFRPRVMAADRLFSWRTPYGFSHDASLLAELPPALVESAKMSITGALATSSKSTYGAGLLRFNQFCDRWQISESARMPASYALLCAFIGNHKGLTSGKTIKSWLSGIRAWHLANHAPWFGDDKWVQMARISANKEGARYKQPLRAPVSIEHLLALRRAISLSNFFHAAVWAVALITFFGCRRLGETTVNSISSFNPSLHVLRSVTYVCFHIL